MEKLPAVSTYSSITIIFIKRKILSLPKHREGVCPMDLNWDLVPENKGLKGEASATQITFRDPWNYL